MSRDAANPGVRRAAQFFLLTLAWSWAFWGILIISGKDWMSPPGMLLYSLGGAGPLIVAAMLVARGYGVDGPARFWRRALDARRVPPVWYLAILLIAILPDVIAGLASGGDGWRGDRESSVALGAILLVGVLAGIAEEPGWRGVALDHLGGRMSALVAGLVIGLVWTLWHVPLYLMEGTVQQEAGLGSPDFWMDTGARLPLAVLYVWVVVGTGGSIFAAILLHAVGNIGSVLIGPESVSEVLTRLVVLTLMAVLVTLFSGPGPGLVWRSRPRMDAPGHGSFGP